MAFREIEKPLLFYKSQITLLKTNPEISYPKA